MNADQLYIVYISESPKFVIPSFMGFPRICMCVFVCIFSSSTSIVVGHIYEKTNDIMLSINYLNHDETVSQCDSSLYHTCIGMSLSWTRKTSCRARSLQRYSLSQDGKCNGKGRG